MAWVRTSAQPINPTNLGATRDNDDFEVSVVDVL